MANNDFLPFIRAIGGGGHYQTRQVPKYSASAVSGMDMAKLILSQASSAKGGPSTIDVSPTMQSVASKKAIEKKKPGFWSRLFDIIQRPQYAVSESVRELGPMGSSVLSPTGFLTALAGGATQGPEGVGDVAKFAAQSLGQHAEGFSGKAKTLPSTVINEQGYLDDAPSAVRGGLNLAADIALDPLNLVPGVALKSALTAPVKAAKAARLTAKGDDLVKAVAKAEDAIDIRKLGLDKVMAPVKPATPSGVDLSSVLGDLAKNAVKGVDAGDLPLPRTFARNVTKAEDFVDIIATGGAKPIVPKRPINKVPVSSTQNAIIRETTSQLARTSRKFNPNLQAQLYNQLRRFAEESLKQVKGGRLAKSSVDDITRAFYHSAVKHLESIGKSPEHWDGTKLNIHDVIDEVGDAKKVIRELRSAKKAPADDVARAIERAKAAGAVDEGAKVVGMVEEGTRRAAEAAAQGLNQASSKALFRDFASEASRLGKDLGMSTASRNTARQLLRGLEKSAAPPVQYAFRTHSRLLDDIAKGSRKSYTPVRRATDNALERQGIAVRAARAGERLTEGEVASSVLGRVAAWHGERDIHNFVVTAKRGARASARARAHTLAKQIEHLDDTGRELAAKAIGGQVPITSLSPEVQRSVTAIQQSMESLFRGSGMSRYGNEAVSMADRSGMVVDDLNKMLEHYGAGKLKFPKDLDDWQTAWTKLPWNGKTLDKDIFTMQSAVEQVAKEYALVDDLAARFGTTVRKPGLQSLDHARLKGTYFKPEMARQIQHALDTMHEFYKPGNKFMYTLREGTNIFKTLVTIPNPQHHMLNFTGDVFLSYLAGVKNPARYKQAARVLKTQMPRFRGQKAIDDLLAEGAVFRAGERTGSKVALKWRGKPITDEQLYVAMFNKGIIQDMHAIEAIADTRVSAALTKGKINPLRAASKVSEINGNYTRAAHFIDAVAKSKAKTLDEAFEEAGELVAKWHPDSLDLTKTEQFIQQLVPFYSWLRKSTPLLIEGALMHPQRVVVPNKAAYQMQLERGEVTSVTDPFNTGGLWPGWMVSPGTEKSVVAPRLPFPDLMSQASRPQTLLGMANPAFKVPFELMTDRRIDTGTPIYNNQRYLAQQLPLVSKGRSMMGAEDKSVAFTNWLTGANIKRPDKPDDPWVVAKKREEQNVLNQEIRQWANNQGYKNSQGEPLSERGRIPSYIKVLFESRTGKKAEVE